MMENIFNELIEKTGNYILSCGLDSMVLGISGGIDSTVCAALCSEVETRYGIKFFGISMPSYTNDPGEVRAARLVGQSFCRPDRFKTIPIQATYNTLEKLCQGCNSSAPSKISRGNIKARLRMIVLYDLAGRSKGLVIDTGNRTENELGFFTIHGDQGDLAPLANFWKHEIFDLGRYLVTRYSGELKKKEAIEKSLLLQPTDGNGPGSDMDQIAPGHTYEEVDLILSGIREPREDWEQEVIRRRSRNAYKQNLPICF